MSDANLTAGKHENQTSQQFPISIQEALGATPLTFLIPTQDLAPFTTFAKLGFPPTEPLEPQRGIPSTLKGSPFFLQAAKELYDFDTSIKESSLRFQGSSTVTVLSTEEPETSLFEGLEGLSKEIVSDITLIEEDQIQEKSVAIHSPEVWNKTATKRPAEQKQEQEQKIILKKKKPDVRLKHLELEILSSQKLTELVKKKLGMRDEDCEYESSDLWIELPNSSHILADEPIVQIEQFLKKIVGTPVLSEIEIEVLERIQVLCMRSLNYAIDLDFSTADIDIWMFKFVINALKSASLVLVIFLSDRNEQKLYLDIYISTLLNCIYKITENLLLPIFYKPTAIDQKLIPSMATAMNLLVKNCNILAQYVLKKRMNDTIITKLEYLSVLIFFSSVDKNHYTKLAPLKTAVMYNLINIFASFKDQRNFLIEEVLSNIDKLSTNKNLARQVKLLKGPSIQHFTELILRISQCYNISEISQEINLKNPRDENKSKVKRGDNTQSIDSDLNDNVFLNRLMQSTKERLHFLSIISSRFINEVERSNSTIIKVFDFFIDDLSSLLLCPDWPASPLLLNAISNTLIFAISSEKYSSDCELLERLGTIASVILQLNLTDDDRNILSSTSSYAAVIQYFLLSGDTNSKNLSSCMLYDWMNRLGVLAKETSAVNSEVSKNAINLIERLMSASQGSCLVEEIKRLSMVETVNDELLTSSYKEVMLSSDLVKCYHNMFNEILRALDSSKAKIRTKALKLLANLIDKDPELLLIPPVKKALSNKISDSSPLVRSSLLDMIDNYTSSRPGSINELYTMMILTNDQAVSVRTKSIKISKKVFSQKINKQVKIFIVDKLLKRLEDDDEHVLKWAKVVLQEILFSNLGSLAINNNEVKLLNETGELIDITLDVINKSEKNWELYETFLNENVIKETNENLKLHGLLLRSVNIYINTLMSYLVEISANDKEKTVEQSLGLLSIFAECNGNFIGQEQLLALQPYLSTDVANSKSTYYTLVICKSTIQKLNSLRPQLIESTQTTLLRRLTKLNSKELDEAVPCVWKLSVMKDDTIKVANAAVSCLGLLKPYVDKVLRDELKKSDAKVIRLLFLIGSFAKYCDLERNRDLVQNSKKLSIKDKESVLSLMVKNILVFTKESANPQIRRVAIRNLMSVCSTHSKLFMSDPVLKVLDREFNANDNMDIKEVMLRCLLDGLKVQERDTALIIENENSRKFNKLNVEVFHGQSKSLENDGIWVSLVQRYINATLEMSLHDEGEQTYSAVKYLGYIVKLGFVNPRLCISTVVALESSPIPYIRSMALGIHREMQDNHESLIESTYINGLKLAVDYRSKQNPAFYKEPPDFFSVFYSVIKDSRSSKNKVFSQIVKYLSFEVGELDLETVKEKAHFVLFMAPNIANCFISSYQELIILFDGVYTIVHGQCSIIRDIVQKALDLPENTENDSDRIKWGKLYYSLLLIFLLHKFQKMLNLEYNIPIKRDNLKLEAPSHFNRLPFEWCEFEELSGDSKEKCKQLLGMLPKL